MNWIFFLAFATFALIVAYLIWNRVSVARQQQGKPASGVGGPHDPLAGATEGIRPPEAIRADLDAAAADPVPLPVKRDEP